MNMLLSLRLARTAALALAVLCTVARTRSCGRYCTADRAATLDSNSPYLKAHLPSGYV